MGLLKKYQKGGELYTYAGRPDSQYKKINNIWYISNKNTNNNFVEIKDPTGNRTKELNRAAKPISLSTENKVDKWLGYPMQKAEKVSELRENGQTESIDNVRHAASAAYTAQALKNKGVPSPLAALGSFGLGAAHEVGTYFTDPRWGSKDSWYNKFTGITREAFEDAYNNGYGVYQWLTSSNNDEAIDKIWEASAENKMADGVAYRNFGNQIPNMYFKNKNGQGSFYQKFKKGGNLLYKKGGSDIKIDPKKKGTFKAQATKMGMGVQEAASHILANKEKYSPAMVKKANFAKNFAK